MIGRALLRLPVRSRLLRSPLSQCQNESALRAPVVLTIRTYATPGRPKRVVGEPSRPVKRAVKKKAAQPADGSSTAEKQVAAKKKAAAKKTRQPLTPEQKAAKKEQQDAAKAAAKAAAKERLEKQKVAQQKRKATAKAEAEKAKITALKKAALEPPRRPRLGAYNVFVAEKMKDLIAQRPDLKSTERLKNASEEVARMWHNATSADLEHYNHLANQKREATEAEFKQWLESHAPEEILAANNARAQLRRLFPVKKKSGNTKWPSINDPRQVKRPSNPYVQFAVNRHNSGDFKNIPLAERSRLIGREWRELSADEKKKYTNMSEQESTRYASEYTETYGQPPIGREAAVAGAA